MKGQDDETINIPLRRLTRFNLESRFQGTALDKFDTTGDSLKNSVIDLNELLSLVRFNLENVPDDPEERKTVIEKVIKDAILQIHQEEGKIDIIRNSIYDLTESSLDEVFELLSGYKISETYNEYSGFLREQKSTKAKKKIDALIDYSGAFIKNIVLRVLYSRSEWILLANKITESEKITGSWILLNH